MESSRVDCQCPHCGTVAHLPDRNFLGRWGRCQNCGEKYLLVEWVAPASESTVVPAPKPISAPVPEPTLKPAPEPTLKPMPEPKTRPVPKPTAKPAREPRTRPVTEPMFDPVPEPTVESAPKPKPTPAAKPAAETPVAPPNVAAAAPPEDRAHREAGEMLSDIQPVPVPQPEPAETPAPAAPPAARAEDSGVHGREQAEALASSASPAPPSRRRWLVPHPLAVRTIVFIAAGASAGAVGADFLLNAAAPILYTAATAGGFAAALCLFTRTDVAG